VDLKFLSVSRRVRRRNVKSKTALESYVAGVPLIPKLAREGAAI
jgi:hypothetical protein